MRLVRIGGRTCGPPGVIVMPSRSEADSLQRTLDKGFRVYGVILPMTPAEIEEKLPRQYWDKQVRRLPLVRDDGEQVSFCYVEAETHALAERLVAEAMKPVGYGLHVAC